MITNQSNCHYSSLNVLKSVKSILEPVLKVTILGFIFGTKNIANLHAMGKMSSKSDVLEWSCDLPGNTDANGEAVS